MSIIAARSAETSSTCTPHIGSALSRSSSFCHDGDEYPAARSVVAHDSIADSFVAGYEDRAPSKWEKNTSSCRVCHVKFGRLMRQHHCRVCGRCVCHGCSRSTIQLDRHSQDVHRACCGCVSQVVQGFGVKERLGQLSGRLCALGKENHSGPDVQSVPCDAKDWDLEQAAALCEASLLSAEESLDRERSRADRAEKEAAVEREARTRLEQDMLPSKLRTNRAKAETAVERNKRIQLEADLVQARLFILQMGEALQSIVRNGCSDPPAEPEDCDISDAITYCESTLDPLKSMVAKFVSVQDIAKEPCGGSTSSETSIRDAEVDQYLHDVRNSRSVPSSGNVSCAASDR